MRKVLLIFLSFRLGDGDTERSMDSFKVIELINNSLVSNPGRLAARLIWRTPLTSKEINEPSLSAYFVFCFCAFF